MINIHCNHCARFLTQVPVRDSQGVAAFKVKQAGFIPKNPILYTGKSEWLYFCSLECNRFYYVETLGISQADLDSMQEKMGEIRREIPAWSKEVAKTVQSLVTHLKPLIKQP